MENSGAMPKRWVLIRGLMRSQYHWKNFADFLKEELKLDSVQSVELPGNGSLYLEKTPATIDQAIAQLKSQLNSSDQNTYGIIGISLGGVLAARWAQLYPNEVSHLVLINSSSKLSPFYKRLQPQNYGWISESLFFSKSGEVEEFILKATSNNNYIWQNEIIKFLCGKKI